MPEERQLGINITARESVGTAFDATSSRIAQLTAQIESLNAALTSNMARGSATFASAIRGNIATAEAELKRLSSQFILQYKNIEDFNIRAIAAMRGQTDAIRGLAREATEADRLSRAGIGRVVYGAVDPLALQTAAVVLTGRARAAREQELGAVFAGIETRTAEQIAREAVAAQRLAMASNEAAVGVRRLTRANLELDAEAVASGGFSGWFSRFLRGGKTPVSLFDEFMRGQRGQMASTLGASFRAAGFGGPVGPLLGVGLAAGGIVIAGEALLRSTESMGRWAETVRAGAEAAGISVSQYSQLQGALELIGLKGNEADLALRTFSRNLAAAAADPLSKQAQAFHALGISQEELVRNGGNVLGMFLRFADAFSTAQAGANRTAAATELVGRSLQRLAPLLARGGDGVKQLMDRARELGIALDEKAAQAIINTGNKAEDLSNTIRGRAIQAFVAWLPEINAVIDAIRVLGTWVGDLVTGLGALLSKINEVSGGWAGAAARFAITPWPSRLLHFGMRALGAEQAPAATAVLPPPLDVQRALSMIEKYESGGRNILQQVASRGVSTASGYFQITDATWREFATKLGIDLGKYPTAMSAPRQIQEQVAARLFEERGFEPWRSNAALMSAVAGRPVGAMDLATRRRDLDNEIQLIRGQTRLREAEYDRQIAAAERGSQRSLEIERQKVTYQEQQSRRLEEVANRRAQLLGRPDPAFFQASEQLTRLQTQQILLQERHYEQMLRDAERTGAGLRAIRGVRGAEAGAQITMMRLGGADEMDIGRAIVKAAQTDAQLVQQEAQKQIQAYEEVIRAAGASSEVGKRAAEKMLEVRTRMVQEEVQDFNKAYEGWKRASQGLNQFFDSLGSALRTATGDILKAVISPQREIIHAGLTTIVETHRGQQIRQAIGRMLISAIDDAAKFAENIASKAIGNLLAKALDVAGGSIGEVLASFIMQKVLGFAAPQAASFVTMTTAATTAAATTVAAATGFAGIVEAAGVAFAASIAASSGAGGAAGFAGVPALAGYLISAAFLGGGIVPSAQAGMVVGGLGATLALLHPREMVLPAHISETIQAMTGSPRAAFAGGASINYAPTFNSSGGGGLSRSELSSILMSHRSDLVGHVTSLIRRGGWRP